MSSSYGLLLPIAYAPSTTNGSVMDLLVTKYLRYGSTVNFRFYPQTESWLSASGVTVAFVLSVNILAGQFLRLIVNSGSNTMTLGVRKQGEISWNAASASNNTVFYSPAASCYITANAREPVAAVGTNFSDILPIFPDVLPAQYTVIVPQTSIAPDLKSAYYNADAQTDAGLSIPENWTRAWENVRVTLWWNEVDTSNYDDVIAVEDALYIRPVPGQLVAVAFRQYLTGVFPGVWSLLVSAVIPGRQVLKIRANDWDDSDETWWTWYTGEYDIPCGQVVTFTGLGGLNVPTASVGTLTKVGYFDDSVDITGLTIYTGGDTKVFPITGTYTGDYRSAIPTELFPGTTIRPCLWPQGASIIVSPPTCPGRYYNFVDIALKYNNTPLTTWIVQPTPSSYPVCYGCCPE